MPRTLKKQPCKLVLGGGAARGLAHIGAIDELLEEYDIRAIVGTSMGAIVGGLLACGYKPHELHRLLDDLHSRNLLSLFDINLQFSGLMTGSNILEWLDDVTGKVKIEDLRIPFAAIAYDLLTKRTVIIDRGRLSWALRASSSLPFLFSPLQWGDYELVDGGAEHPLPLEFDSLFDELLPTVAINVLPPVPNEPITLDLREDEQPRPSKRNLLNVALAWSTDNQHFLATRALMNADVELMISAHTDDLDESDFLSYESIIEVGRRAAKKALRERTPYSIIRSSVMGYLQRLKELRR